MTPITEQMLLAYLEDALSEAESSLVERELRDSQPLRGQLKELIAALDRGDHSVGGIWRRHRLSCPSRDQLGSFLLDALDADHRDYVAFHLETIGCPFCRANLDDLKSQDRDDPLPLRRRILDSTADAFKRPHPDDRKPRAK